MDIRYKLTLPLLTAFGLIIVVLHFSIAPAWVNDEREVLIEQQQALIESLKPDITQHMLTGDLATLYSILDDQLLLMKQSWLRLTLTHYRGYRLYPVDEPEPIANRENIITRRYTIGVDDERLGDLEVVTDFSLIAEHAKSRIRELEILLLGVFSVLFVFSLTWQSALIRVPLARLETAANRLATGDFGVQMPVVQNDEIGRLNRAFNTMRDNLQKAQNKLRVAAEDAVEAERKLQKQQSELIEEHQRVNEVLAKLAQQNDELEAAQIEQSHLKTALHEHAIVCVLDKDEFIQDVNQKFTDISGYTRDELLNRHFCININEDQVVEFYLALSSVIQRGEVWHGEICCHDKNGKPYWTTSTITPFIDKEGEIYKFVAVSTSITDQKLAEKKLTAQHNQIRHAHREIQQQQQALDEHAIVSISNTDGNIIYANDKFCKISGYTGEELLGKNHRIVKSDVHPPEFFKDLWQTISQGRVWKGELCNIAKNGMPFWVAATIIPILDEQAQPLKYIAMRTDITELKNTQIALQKKNIEIEKAHKELEQSHEQAVQAEKLASVGQLAAGIAHEINTPIQFVGDNTRFLQDAFDDLLKLVQLYTSTYNDHTESADPSTIAEQARILSDEIEVDYLAEEIPNAFKQSLEGIDRVSQIVRSMKDFSHPGKNQKELIDINQAIESTVVVSRNEWKYDAELVTEFDETLTAVPCYPGEFNQVILNIIVNAAHAIKDARGDDPELGTITIKTRQNNEYAEIQITDTGPGMPEDVRKRIFEPFFTTKGVGKGSGQGLAITYSVITDKHGGSIQVDSTVGVGTTFTIRLPMTDVDDNFTEDANRMQGAG